MSGKTQDRNSRRRSGRHRAGDQPQGRARSRRARRLRSDPGLRSGRARASRQGLRHRGELHVVGGSPTRTGRATLNVLACPQPETASLDFGVVSPVSGRASIAFCAAAIKAALAGEVDAVVAAPQNETSIAQAGIKFDGHPSFVARQTGTDENDVYMMLCFGDTKIAHCTLHRSVREAIALITREKVARVIRVDRRARCKRSASPRRRSPSAASIRTPAKAGCSAARRSRSSSRRWRRPPPRG